MQTTNEPTTARHLETETCSRCGGSGNYSYCQSYGTTCFRCCGRKRTYTKRGHAALLYLKQLRSRPIETIQVGDVVKMGGVTMSCQVYDVWVKVTQVSRRTQEGSSLQDGVMVPYSVEQVVLSGLGKGTEYATASQPGTLIEVVLPKDEQHALLAQALDYQDTLTKAGAPRQAARLQTA